MCLLCFWASSAFCKCVYPRGLSTKLTVVDLRSCISFCHSQLSGVCLMNTGSYQRNAFPSSSLLLLLLNTVEEEGYLHITSVDQHFAANNCSSDHYPFGKCSTHRGAVWRTSLLGGNSSMTIFLSTCREMHKYAYKYARSVTNVWCVKN